MQITNTIRLLRYVRNNPVFTIQDLKPVLTANNIYDVIKHVNDNYLVILHFDVRKNGKGKPFRVYYLNRNKSKALDYARSNGMEVCE